jgi:hypothetical protein
MNKELEDYAERTARAFDNDNYKALMQLVIEGAKYMEEQMFSKEDMREAIIFGVDGMYGYQWGKEGETENQINKYLQELKKK